MLPSNSEMESIRKNYEAIYNDTNVQVDLFIYFIGKDIRDIRQLQWEKCLRNGKFDRKNFSKITRKPNR